MLFATSCNKEASAPEGGSAKTKANVSLSIVSAPTTKATEPENKLNSVEVFIFDNGESSTSKGFLEAYKKAASTDFVSASSANLTFNASTGSKHIYVLANAVAAIGESVTTESELKAKISEFTDNATDSFIMVGGAEVTLTSEHNNEIALSCRRLVSKISFGYIQGAFESPALRTHSFVVNRVYLMNVPKQAKFVNGDAPDVFGTVGTSAYTEGANYPSIFVPAIKEGSTLYPYYKFADPALNGTQANGYYNWFNATEFNNTKTVSLDAAANVMTTETITSGVIYPGTGTDHKVTLNRSFYTYPNPAVHSSADNVADNTTKVVVETTLNINGNDKKYYYPISIPYTQPNYYYRIESLTIKRLGSDNPSLPVTKAVCEFTVTVRDWDTGEIVGQFNNETSEGVFEF